MNVTDVQRARVAEEEGDFYATVIYDVIVALFPAHDPQQVADAVLKAYRKADDVIVENANRLVDDG